MVSCYLLSPVQLVTILNTTVLQMPCNNWLQHILHFKTSSGDLPKPKVWRAFLSTIWNEDQTGLEGEKGLLVTTAASNRKGSTIYLQSDCSEQAFAWVHTGKNGWLLAEWSGSSLAAFSQVVGVHKSLLLSVSIQLVGFPFPYEVNLVEREKPRRQCSVTPDSNILGQSLDPLRKLHLKPCFMD